MIGTHAVKIRHPGDKRYMFYASSRNTCLSRLRIHATLFTEERAEEVAAALRRNNPCIRDIKVVRMYKE